MIVPFFAVALLFKTADAATSWGNYGDHGVPGVLEGTLEFAFDSSTRICGEYTLHYAGVPWLVCIGAWESFI